MGLLDDILKSALGGRSASGSQASSLVQSVLDLLEDDRQEGGLDGLSRRFEEKGLGDVISSWIGTGGAGPFASPGGGAACRRAAADA